MRPTKPLESKSLQSSEDELGVFLQCTGKIDLDIFMSLFLTKELGRKLSISVLQYYSINSGLFLFFFFFNGIQELNCAAGFGPYLPEADRRMNV